jgi:hypothetical protein
MAPANRYLYYPFQLGAQGGVSVTDDPDRHLRDKIEAVLFTAPGERVDQPEFGAGLTRAVFEGLDDLTLAAFEFRVSSALRRDLGDEVIFDEISLKTEPDSGEVLLHLVFRRRTERQPRNLEIRL